jgi:hypothetical protein
VAVAVVIDWQSWKATQHVSFLVVVVILQLHFSAVHVYRPLSVEVVEYRKRRVVAGWKWNLILEKALFLHTITPYLLASPDWTGLLK